MESVEELKQEIKKIKKDKNAIILAHFYQDKQIQEIADFIGDSLDLSYKAKNTNADLILFSGVVFMGETAKIVSPKKKVLVPDLNAGCSLVDYLPVEKFRNWRAAHPDHIAVTYINCSAEVKAMSDIICTSSNAEKIINSIPPDQPILFAPDRNLGRYLIKKTGRNMLLWDGACIVHELFSEQKLKSLKAEHLGYKIIAHPECASIVINIADFIGSTKAMLDFTIKDNAPGYIVVTEAGIIHQMEKSSPHKKFIPAPSTFYSNCNCNECPYMRMNTIENIYRTLLEERNEITLSDYLIDDGQKAINRMFDISFA